MKEKHKDYHQIMKATSLFGGVQVITILIGVIRSKIVAVLLGTAGVGVINLLTTTTSFIINITSFGLASSAVRDISAANGSIDTHRISSIIKTLRRWVFFTGLLGALVTLIFAPYLSRWTFGSDEYTWSFIWLSVTCFLTAVSSGQMVLLQGLRKLRQMAKASVLGSLLGLFTSVPLYFLFGTKGIVPALIISALSALLISFYFSRKISVVKVSQTWNETWNSGKGMAKLGFVMMLNGLMLSLAAYVVNIFISNIGGVSQVGLYSSGWTITNQYTALIFTAMGTDYFSRISAIHTDNLKLRTAVNQQAEIAILILGPFLVLLIGFIPFVLQLIYTEKFLPITGMIKWNMLGMLFKASSWAMAFSIIAKGDNRLFFATETIANIAVLSFNLAGYYLWGLDGIGISFTISYILYFLMIFIVVKKKYTIYYDSLFWKIFVFQFVLVLCTFLICFFSSSMLVYFASALIFIVSALFSLYELNKRMDLKAFLNILPFKR